MRTMSIRQLHARTGKIVRAAQKDPVFVTDHGTVIAVLRAVNPTDMAGRPFLKGHWARLPPVKSRGDSTQWITEDRNH
ncbi:MAG: hypothetical protein JNK54_07695 [Elusimicrobia bacterium]|nr:hypothetical protein [Elusimicrobiota bacterium]